MAAILLILAVTVAVALLASPLADAFPASGGLRSAVERAMISLAALTGLLLAIRWRIELHRPVRLLIHVRLADESIPTDESRRERHLGLLHQARRRDMMLKSITRWINLAPPDSHDPVNLVTQCAEVATGIEAMVNQDTEGSRLTLAADMPWPIALGVGAQLPVTMTAQLMELTGWPDGTGAAAPEARFPLPWKPPRSLEALAVERSTVPVPSTDGRIGLLLAITESLRHLDPVQVFAGLNVSEYHVVQPSWAAVEGEDVRSHRFTGKELADLARRLPPVIASIKQRTKERELVIAAAIPSSLAMAIGWGLTQNAAQFFADTHLLYYDLRRNRYRTLRVHPSQPTGPAH